MPQLDINSYLMQIFWLLVIFPVLYLFVSGYFLPTVSEVVKSRAAKVDADIAEAEKTIDEHKALKAEIESIINNARSSALQLKSNMMIEAKKTIDSQLKSFEADLAKRTAEEEKRLDTVKMQFQSELPTMVKELSNDIFKAALDSFETTSGKMN